MARRSRRARPSAAWSGARSRRSRWASASGESSSRSVAAGGRTAAPTPACSTRTPTWTGRRRAASSRPRCIRRVRDLIRARGRARLDAPRLHDALSRVLVEPHALLRELPGQGRRHLHPQLLDGGLSLRWDGEPVRAPASKRGEIPMSRLLTIATVAAGLLIAGCGDDDESESTAGGGAAGTEAAAPPSTESSTKPASGSGVTIKASESDFGTVLFDGKDQAIYLFDKETGPKSECYGDCAAAWPPVLTEGEPKATGDVDAGLLGTIQRDDG